MQDITFLKPIAFESNDTVSFTAQVDEVRTDCSISMEAIHDIAHSTGGRAPEKLLQAFRDNEAEIKLILLRKLKRTKIEKGDTVFISTADI